MVLIRSRRLILPTCCPLTSGRCCLLYTSVPSTQVKPRAAAEPAADAPLFRLIGEAMCTYILVEQGDKLILIDKHAAHERILFDRMKAGHASEMQQLLLTPVVCKLGPENAAILAENIEALTLSLIHI